MTREEIVQALIKLLDESGQQRLEIFRGNLSSRYSGYCVSQDNTHWYIIDYMEE
jgi:hypothetical protein